jgi:hypothetical protein
MDILLDILIIISTIVVGAILVILIVAFLAWLFGNDKTKSIAKKGILYVSDCDGMCEHCNEELKELCKENKKCL